MYSYTLAALFAFLAVANAGVLVGPAARIVQGPSSRTTVVGPDGSAISSVAPGGQIVQQESYGLVAQTASLVAASPAVAYSAPVAPVISAYSSPFVSGYSAPLVSAYSGVGAVVSGPSGSIATGRAFAAW